MSYRVRVSVHPLAHMLRVLDANVNLDIMLPPDVIARMVDTLPPVLDEHGLELTRLLRTVLQAPEGDQVVHSLVI